tara:strand:+ start:607 stop:834 length:228 start_codon:yes stop_codon:yes gene_type:complete
MVTVEVKNLEEVKQLEFPKLMKGITGVVVWFSVPGEGTVIIGTKGACYTAGDYECDFVMSNFKDFNEELTLKNKQ